MAAVDPDARDAERLRGHVVVIETLGDVYELFAVDGLRGEPIEGAAEMTVVGFVGAGVLGGDDSIEFDAELLVGRCERCAIDVGENDEAEALLE